MNTEKLLVRRRKRRKEGDAEVVVDEFICIYCDSKKRKLGLGF